MPPFQSSTWIARTFAWYYYSALLARFCRKQSEKEGKIGKQLKRTKKIAEILTDSCSKQSGRNPQRKEREREKETVNFRAEWLCLKVLPADSWKQYSAAGRASLELSRLPARAIAVFFREKFLGRIFVSSSGIRLDDHVTSSMSVCTYVCELTWICHRIEESNEIICKSALSNTRKNVKSWLMP